MKKWILILGIWTIPVVIAATHVYLYSSVRGEAMHLTPVLLFSMSEWYTWAALTPFILWLAGRYPIDRPAFGKALLIHVGAAVLFSVIQSILQEVIRYYALSRQIHTLPFFDTVTQSFGIKFHISFATYAVIVSCSHAVEYYRRYRERETRSAHLEATLAQAQLQALRMQIQPHFLFNTLNSISALIDEDKKAAHKMLAQLGDFLRLTLKNAGNQSSTLEQELQFLKSYLQIEQVRFGERLKISIDVDPSTINASVPSLILQPIVENAFRHAISKVELGAIDIKGRRHGDTLELTIKDNGPGMVIDTKQTVGGLGLSNTRARLEMQYGRLQSLTLENAREGGLVVTIRFPYQNGQGPSQ